MKRKKKKNNNIVIIIIFVFIIVSIITGLYFYLNTDELSREMNINGYTLEKEGKTFYKKIVTDNTMDEYYEKISNNIDSEYKEYCYTIGSNDFIEISLSEKNGINKSLTISSDLKRNEIVFNYELSEGKNRLMLEGNSSENYKCNIITKNGISDDNINKYCNEIINEINQFKLEEQLLLSDEKIKEIVENN